MIEEKRILMQAGASHIFGISSWCSFDRKHIGGLVLFILGNDEGRQIEQWTAWVQSGLPVAVEELLISKVP